MEIKHNRQKYSEFSKTQMGNEVEICGDFVDVVLHSLHYLSIHSGTAAVCHSRGLRETVALSWVLSNRLVKIHFRIRKIPSALGQMLRHCKTVLGVVSIL